MSTLVIIGAGGFGREALAWARQSVDPIPVKGFLDDNPRALDGFGKDVPILGAIAEYRPQDGDLFICAMGNVAFKQRSVEQILSRGGIFTRVIHSTSVVGENVALGAGVIEAMGFPAKNKAGMERTLERLDKLVTTGSVT